MSDNKDEYSNNIKNVKWMVVDCQSCLNNDNGKTIQITNIDSIDRSNIDSILEIIPSLYLERLTTDGILKNVFDTNEQTYIRQLNEYIRNKINELQNNYKIDISDLVLTDKLKDEKYNELFLQEFRKKVAKWLNTKFIDKTDEPLSREDAIQYDTRTRKPEKVNNIFGLFNKSVRNDRRVAPVGGKRKTKKKYSVYKKSTKNKSKQRRRKTKNHK